MLLSVGTDISIRRHGLVWFGLVWFYGISTIVGSLMPNPVFTYILNTSFENRFLGWTQLNDQTLLFLTV